jgi:hypothetical protein
MRWENGVDQDMRILEVKNWKKVTLGRDEWAKLLKKAWAHQVLSSQWWWCYIIIAIDIDATEHTLKNPQTLIKVTNGSNDSNDSVAFKFPVASKYKGTSNAVRIQRVFGQSILLRIKRRFIHPGLNFFFKFFHTPWSPKSFTDQHKFTRTLGMVYKYIMLVKEHCK